MRLKLRVNESQREISHQYDQEIPIMIYADAANKCRKLISGANVLNGDRKKWKICGNCERSIHWCTLCTLEIYRIGFKLQIGHYVSDFLVCHAVLLDDHNQVFRHRIDTSSSIRFKSFVSKYWLVKDKTRCWWKYQLCMDKQLSYSLCWLSRWQRFSGDAFLSRCSHPATW